MSNRIFTDEINFWANEATETKDREYRKVCLQMQAELYNRENRLEKLLQSPDKGIGMQLGTEEGEAYCIILQDATEPEKYRYQVFDGNGMLNHHTCESLDEAVTDAFLAGFELEAPEALEELSATHQWKQGINQHREAPPLGMMVVEAAA